MDHRFTEPTPASQVGYQIVEVFVASWEIECCAPPPEVGSLSSWTLQFYSAAEFPDPELDHESTWWATPWSPSETARPVVTQLRRGPITACWNMIVDADGSMRLRGHLSGTIHGIVPEDFPCITGRVDRLRLVTQQHAKVAPGGWEPVPGTITLTDIQQSPHWFTGDPAAPPVDGSDRILQTGVLLDLAVPEDPG